MKEIETEQLISDISRLSLPSVVVVLPSTARSIRFLEIRSLCSTLICHFVEYPKDKHQYSQPAFSHPALDCLWIPYHDEEPRAEILHSLDLYGKRE